MDPFLQEYSSSESVRQYVRDTAGSGIAHLMENVYGPIYRKWIGRPWEKGLCKGGIRILEYGCGGGMNLLHIVNTLAELGIPLEAAYGTDFSAEMIKAANSEAASYLETQSRPKVRFVVAANENLINGLATGLCLPASGLLDSFHLILGVNTFRYCHRLKKADECAKSIYDLLAKGGTSVMIDMNKDFPFFRSRLRDALTKPKEEIFLPSLQEYALPFERAGFQIAERRNFCWIPHSAGSFQLAMLRRLAPLLDQWFPNSAMRSLIIGVKPD